MNKKKIVLAVASVAVIGAVTVGGTLAWFTSKQSTPNVVTTGNIQISLKETNSSTFDNIVPGQDYSLDPTIKNESALNSAYIRAKIEIVNAESPIIPLTPAQKDKIQALLRYDIVAANWVKNTTDGYYYYVADTDSDTKPDGVLAATQEVKLFTKVTVPGEDWKNELASLGFKINVTAEAIQAKNFTFDATAAQPTWGSDSKGNAITAE